VIEPYHGRILDPACGSGGMFVQSARFVAEHQQNPAAELAICGVEKTDETGRLCRLNLAVHGLEGDIRHGGNVNSYYDDPHAATGQFDFVLANPPFNVNAVDKERLKDMVGAGRRFPFGLPRTDNANYLWIQLFYSSLNAKGRAGFVMANSASDARASEAGAAAEADRGAGGRRDGRRRPQHVLHRHAALHAVVPRPGQGEDRSAPTPCCSSTPATSTGR
jgi:type I restriction enzyme M protein